ncbi:MAG TPA: hypothetical protein VHJ18_04520 [Streptosporangiaceae bacterium]|jgi:hypothetical protein|nr:hypothetical protein [Streptosporangiaceae bacterium]
MMAKLYRFWICPPVVERATFAFAGGTAAGRPIAVLLLSRKEVAWAALHAVRRRHERQLSDPAHRRL